MVLTSLALVNCALMYALDLTFARSMGTGGYENYSVAVAVLVILSTFSTFGIEKYALRAIPTYVEMPTGRICAVSSDSGPLQSR